MLAPFLVIAAFLAAIVALSVLVSWLSARKPRVPSAVLREHYEALLPELGPTVERNERHGRSTVRVLETRIPGGDAEVMARLVGVNLHLSVGSAPSAAPRAGSPFRSSAREAPLPVLPEIALREETDRDRLGKRLRLNREIETGDAAFDDAVYVESDEPDAAVHRVLADAEQRERLRALVAASHLLHIGRNGAAVRLTVAPRVQHSREELLELARELVAVVAALPPAARIRERSAMKRGAKLALAAISALGLGFVAMALAEQWPPAGRPLQRHAMLAGAGAFVVVMAGCYALLRGRADRWLAWTAPSCVVACPLWAVASLQIANGAGDASERVQRTTIITRYQEKQRSSRSYYARLRPWSPHDRPVTVRVSRSVYPHIHPDAAIDVRLGSGRLGYEWVRGVNVLPRSSSR